MESLQGTAQGFAQWMQEMAVSGSCSLTPISIATGCKSLNAPI